MTAGYLTLIAESPAPPLVDLTDESLQSSTEYRARVVLKHME